MTPNELFELKDRILSSFSVDENGCWVWNKGIVRGRGGYGRLKFKGKWLRAHRASYMVFVGDFNSSLHVCHKCDNPPCVNPDHLFVGTAMDNIQDKINKGRAKYKKLPRFEGESHPQSKLTEDDVRKIRKEKGMVKDIAEKYGVSGPMISYIRNGKNWSHVK